MMRLDAKQLQAALKTVAPAVDAHPVNEALAAVQIDSLGTFSATNWETWIRTAADADSDDDLDVGVSHKLLSAIAGFARGDVLMESDGRVLTVKSGGNRWTLPLMDAEALRWPSLPPLWGTVDGSELARCVKSAAMASGDGKELDKFKAMHLSGGDGTLLMQATDRYRVHVLEAKMVSDVECQPVALVEAKSFGPVVSVLAGEVNLHATADGSQFGLADHATTVIVKQMAVELIPFHQFAQPDNPPAETTFDASVMLDALKAVSPAVAAMGGVLLRITPDSLTVTATDETRTAESTVSGHEHVGQGLVVKVNPRFFADAVSVLDAETVVAKWTRPKAPVHLLSPSSAHRAVVMPVTDPRAGWLNEAGDLE